MALRACLGLVRIVVSCMAMLVVGGCGSDAQGDALGEGSGAQGGTAGASGYAGAGAADAGAKTAACGNGALDNGEACDGANLGGKSCEGLGHAFGTLACKADCSLDKSGCYDCGSTDGRIFDSQAKEYLTDGWKDRWSPSNTGWRRGDAIWAMLEDRNGEKLYEQHAADIRAIVRGWSGSGCPGLGAYTEDDPWYWGQSFGDGNMAEIPFLTRILLQYPDRVDKDVLACLKKMLPGGILLGGGNANTYVGRTSALFVLSQEDREREVLYGEAPYLGVDFTWDGRSYEAGQKYRAYDLLRDWWYWRMGVWAAKWDLGGTESDSEAYTWLFLNGLHLIYDFADRPLEALGGKPDPDGVELKNRAKMILDLVLLDNVMDMSGDQHGGWLGRTYFSTIDGGYLMQPYSCYWGNADNAAKRFYYVSKYRLPYVIEDLGKLDDEDGGYWHINRENRGGGKWDWVAKDYNLGGGADGPISYMSAWQLNIAGGSPSKLFINTYEKYETADSYGYANALGEWGYLWRYAGLVSAWGGKTLHVHVLTGGKAADEVVGMQAPSDPYGSWTLQDDWGFFRKGNVMVAVGRASDKLMSFEIALQGVEQNGVKYDSLSSFRQAVAQSAKLGFDGDMVRFTTSRGDTIAFDGNPVHNAYMNTLVRRSGETSYAPFDTSVPVDKRILSEDDTGRPIVAWDGAKMTVERHGCGRVYDFESWKVSDLLTPECQLCKQAKP